MCNIELELHPQPKSIPRNPFNDAKICNLPQSNFHPDSSCRRVHPIRCDRCIARNTHALTLTPRTIVNNLMGKEIAVDAEMVSTSSTFVPTTSTHPLGMILSRMPLIFRRHRREVKPTSKASRAYRSPIPRDFDPIDQREKMVIRARQMGGKNQSQSARWTFSR
jgi:hypothetical protein